MKKLFLIMFAAFFSGSIYAQTDLFFSEYVEGSGNNKGVEIYNPTANSIDLNNYWVARYSNGAAVYAEGGLTHLSGTIAPYKTFVLVNGQTTSTSSSPACSPVLQAMADQLDHEYPAPTYMNGNDAIALLKTPNGETPNSTNVTAVDLIGEIGLGAAISAETGWSYVKDSTLTYNNSAGTPVTGKVINYIVQSKATDGTTYGPFWMSWTSDHSLIRKPTVIAGVVGNPDPFIVTMEWDTVPGVPDSLGHLVYKDIWTNLGSHGCIADPNYLGVGELPAMGNLKIYPNPIVSDYFTFESNAPVKSIRVYDILGNEIVNDVYSSPVKETKVKIGTKSAGVYMVKATYSDNSTRTQKMMIK